MENKEIIPIRDRILVKLPPLEKQLVNGLVQLESAHDYAQRGKVIAVGLGRFGKKGGRIPVDCKPGDEVYITKFAGIQVKFDNEQYLMVFNEDIVGVFS